MLGIISSDPLIGISSHGLTSLGIDQAKVLDFPIPLTPFLKNAHIGVDRGCGFENSNATKIICSRISSVYIL